MDHLRCVVERITYQNETNGFSVIKCRAKGYNDLVTVVGNMPDIHVGSVLTMEGQWRVDRKFGRQFSAEKWHKIPKGCELTEEQQKYVVDVLMEWIERQMSVSDLDR